ncbi:MAG: hemerythrin domain-containing protein [Solirubrobacteraceae bacterium]
MKRSDALAKLSRDHHHALVAAMRLRRADAATAAEARDVFLAFWTSEGAAHFRLEEEVLLPAYAAFGDAHHPLVLRALGEHVEIRQRALAVAAGGAPDIDALHDLGTRLAAHVRLEERELFVHIEETMPPQPLAAVAGALDEAERRIHAAGG